MDCSALTTSKAIGLNTCALPRLAVARSRPCPLWTALSISSTADSVRRWAWVSCPFGATSSVTQIGDRASIISCAVCVSFAEPGSRFGVQTPPVGCQNAIIAAEV